MGEINYISGKWGTELGWWSFLALAKKVASLEKNQVYLVSDSFDFRFYFLELLYSLLRAEKVGVKILEAPISLGEFSYWKDKFRDSEKVLIYITTTSDDYFNNLRIFWNLEENFEFLETFKPIPFSKLNLPKLESEKFNFGEEYHRHLFQNLKLDLIREEELNIFVSLPISPFRHKWQNFLLELGKQLVFWKENTCLGKKESRDYLEEARNFFWLNGFDIGAAFDCVGDDFRLFLSNGEEINNHLLFWYLLYYFFAQEEKDSFENCSQFYFPYESFIYRKMKKILSNRLSKGVFFQNDSFFLFCKGLEMYSFFKKDFRQLKQKFFDLIGERIYIDVRLLRINSNIIPEIASNLGGNYKNRGKIHEVRKGNDFFLAFEVLSHDSARLYIEATDEKKSKELLSKIK